jgi:hypothetical protein
LEDVLSTTGRVLKKLIQKADWSGEKMSQLDDAIVDTDTSVGHRRLGYLRNTSDYVSGLKSITASPIVGNFVSRCCLRYAILSSEMAGPSHDFPGEHMGYCEPQNRKLHYEDEFRFF